MGSKEDADTMIDDLMEDDYFKYIQGNATEMKTAKWNTRNRKRKTQQKIEDLPNS